MQAYFSMLFSKKDWIVAGISATLHGYSTDGFGSCGSVGLVNSFEFQNVGFKIIFKTLI